MKKKAAEYIRKIWKKAEDEDIQLDNTLYENLNILNDDNMTLGGLLFFGKHPQRYRPAFCIKAISFFGNSIGGTEYRDSRDIMGTIPEMFSERMRFFTGNLRHIQAGQNFNSTGVLEISRIALEELLQNAVLCKGLHKMTFISSSRVAQYGYFENGSSRKTLTGIGRLAATLVSIKLSIFTNDLQRFPLNLNSLRISPALSLPLKRTY
jgi:hypothetical protein